MIEKSTIYQLIPVLKEYDKVIRTQAEFDALIASPTWLGAKSVAFFGAFTLSTINNSGILIPQTVEQIQGFNGATFNIENSKRGGSGLWYASRPTNPNSFVKDISINLAMNGGGDAISQIDNISNCNVIIRVGKITEGVWGIISCNNVTNCKVSIFSTDTFGSRIDGISCCLNINHCETELNTSGNACGIYDIPCRSRSRTY